MSNLREKCYSPLYRVTRICAEPLPRYKTIKRRFCGRDIAQLQLIIGRALAVKNGAPASAESRPSNKSSPQTYHYRNPREWAPLKVPPQKGARNRDSPAARTMRNRPAHSERRKGSPSKWSVTQLRGEPLASLSRRRRVSPDGRGKAAGLFAGNSSGTRARFPPEWKRVYRRSRAEASARRYLAPWA